MEYEAWLYGIHVAYAIQCSFSKNASYPPNPLLESDSTENDGEAMTDGEQFALFAMKHNRQLEKKRANKINEKASVD